MTLTVSLSNPQPALPWLTPGQQYRVFLNVPSPDGGDPYGLLAIDGATLSAPVTLLFTAGAAPPDPYSGPPTMSFCDDILAPIFLRSCAFTSCHGMAQADGGAPVLGLDLQTASGVRATAVGQVADESNTGPMAQTVAQLAGSPFGVDMAVITAGEPGNSWLMYKVLLAIPEAADAEVTGADSGVSAYGQGLVSPVSAAERARLSDYILGQSMPYPAPSQAEPSPSPLTTGDLERLSTWIAQGAATPSSCR